MGLDREGYLRNLRELEAGREVFVRPLELEATADDVRDIVVQRCGEDSVGIDRVKLVKHAGGALLSAFVTLSSVQEARLVTQRLDGAKIRGKVLAVSVARNQGQSRVKEICMFFLEGKCQRGQNCQYLHDATGRGSGRRLPACRFFAAGSCSRGENCKFSHERQDDVEEAGTVQDDVEEAAEVQTERLTSKHKRLKHPPDPTQTAKKKKTKEEATISAKMASTCRPGREGPQKTKTKAKAEEEPEEDEGDGSPKAALKRKQPKRREHRAAATQSEAPAAPGSGPQDPQGTAKKKRRKLRRKTAQDVPAVPTAAPAAKGQKTEKKRTKRPQAAA
ncbi:ZC3H6 [Symbiodinium necroappetens]|uniref:ZC3H6 protein n=1 Tax=Symbiodinium necroappetens TaxID=1628268 RepID=A0A812JMS4_9DINO|nr:ZC3H6 [Symbiodinium necroappetens]